MATTRPKPTLVLLVRHGQTPTTGTVLPGRAPGLHLSEAGHGQAEAVAERIGVLGDRVTGVYSSPLERTRETAAPIARAVGRRVRARAELADCDPGEWTGRRLSALRRRREWRTVQERPSGFRFPRGESFGEMQLRATTAVETIRRDHPGSTVVVVSHADPIASVVTDAFGLHLDLFQRVTISPCSVTSILYSEGAPRVLTVNGTGHELAAMAPTAR